MHAAALYQNLILTAERFQRAKGHKGLEEVQNGRSDSYPSHKASPPLFPKTNT